MTKIQEPTSDDRARKRQSIGLSARRPTAKAVIRRPPEGRSDGLMWLAVGLLVVMSLATAMMALTALQDTEQGTQAVSPLAGEAGGAGAADRLLLQDDFDAPVLTLAQDRRPGYWSLGYRAGAYRIEIVRPGHLAWSSLGMLSLGPHRLETSVVVAEETPWGYAGLLSRYQNEARFYLFAVDGRGAYQVQLQDAGAWHTLQPWTRSDAIRPAGRENVLALEDDGGSLRFFVNDSLLFVVESVRLLPGDLGLAGGARSQGGALVDFDRVRVYGIPLGAAGGG